MDTPPPVWEFLVVISIYLVLIVLNGLAIYYVESQHGKKGF